MYWLLAVAFPRRRRLGLIALGRLVLDAHYLSDVWLSLWPMVALIFPFDLLNQLRVYNETVAVAG